MADAPETPTALPAVPNSTPPPDAPATGAIIERDTFIETFTVREKGRRYEVAANAIANRAYAQVNVAKLRSLIERVMKPYEDDPKLIPGPKELKVIVEAVQAVDAMANDAYSDKKAGGLANSLERLVYAATRGAAAGAGDAKKMDTHGPEARLRRLNDIGKKQAPKAPAETVVDLDE